MDPVDALLRLLDERGYEMVDPKRKESLARILNGRQSSPKKLRRIVVAWIRNGHIRPRTIKPKDDEAFRLFLDESSSSQ